MDIVNAIVGILLIINGMRIYHSAWDSFYELPMPPSVGILMSLIGIVFFISAFFIRKSKKSKERVKCTECGTTYMKKYVTFFKCPKCDGKLIDKDTQPTDKA